MTPFDVVSLGTAGLLISGAGLVGIGVVLRGLAQRRPVVESLAARDMARTLGLEPSTLEGAELNGLVASGVLDGESPISLAVRWHAPDATFTAFVAASQGGREGVVIVTPREITPERSRLPDYARIVHRRLVPVPIPPRLRADLPGVSAHRLDRRLVVQKLGVEDGETLERLVMLACALLDAE